MNNEVKQQETVLDKKHVIKFYGDGYLQVVYHQTMKKCRHLLIVMLLCLS